MPNAFFQFKKFSIYQEKSAMKVSTDACLLGAYTAKQYAQSATNILDIGAGTGLLSLMLAQVSACPIVAVEIDESAYLQTQENFSQSSWADRLQVVHQSIQEFTVLQNENCYDLIICNPPFFVNSLKSEKKEKNLARHTDSLPFKELIACGDKLLLANGVFVLLLPVKEAQLFEKELDNDTFDFYISERLHIQDNLNKLPHRVILTLRKRQHSGELATGILNKNLTVKDLENNYTAEFVDLMQEYYLKL